ncbi:Transmembrane protein, putative [Arachis hypogaea]|nr:Transmembrane protein, putative [Arachis hypogaea]
MSGSKKIKKYLSIKVQKFGNKEVNSAHKTKLSHPKPTKSRAPVPSHVSKKPSALPLSSSHPPQKFKRNLLSSHADHTPSPSPSPAESPYYSPIQPQSFDNTPNNERNLYHAHSSDENHQDESLAQEGELVTQEGLLKIVPFGNEFNPCTAVRHVTSAIKSKFSEFCPSWRHANLKFKNWSVANTVNRASNAGSSMHTGGSISMGEHARRMGDVEASKEGLDIPDDYTVWNEVVTKGKKKAAFGLGSFGLDLSSKLDSRNCSETSKDNLNIEQELHMWKEKAKEQEMINEEQKVKLKDAEHKLKDLGRQLKVQQKRIGSTEKTIHALYKNLNLPLPSTLSGPTEDELGTGSSDDNMSD